MKLKRTVNGHGIYCNQNWLNNKMNKAVVLDKYTNWIAIYPKTIDFNKYNGKYDIWQCSPNGQINGISGKVDINIMYRDLITEIGLNKEADTIIQNDKYYPKCSSSQKSIADGLYEIGVNGSYANRCLIAQTNGIYNYVGNYGQNMFLLNLLKRGELLK